MIFLLYLGTFICGFVSVLTNQKYARSTKSANDFLVYALVTGMAAMGVFYVASGFNIVLNTRTNLYGLAFAVVIFISYFFALAAFQYMGVAEKSFICSGLSILMSVSIGCLVYSERITLVSFVQIVLVIFTQLALFMGKRENENRKTVTWTGVAICIIIAILSTASSAITKSFAIDSGVTDSTSFFFITNVFIVAMSLVSVLVINKGSLKISISSFRQVSPIGYLLILACVVASNIGSVLQVEILKLCDLIIYTPLSSALSLLAGEAVAVFVAKERPRVVATILAISSVLVVLLF